AGPIVLTAGRRPNRSLHPTRGAHAHSRRAGKLEMRIGSEGRESLGLLTGQLDRGDVRGDRGGLEDDLAVVDVDDDRLARLELLPQELLGERVLHQTLDRAAQRTRTQGGVVP